MRLKGHKFAAVATSEKTLPRMMIENYRIWQQQCGWVKDVDASSILFDCVAVHLAYSTRFLKMNRMGECASRTTASRALIRRRRKSIARWTGRI